jgi:AcrR family transcriptional regulator
MEDPNDLSPRRRLTQAEAKEQTRRRLLGAAARVFAQKGFAGASLEEISELAGYTTGALYHHFANKEQLFLELLRTGWSIRNVQWVEAVSRVFEDQTTDPFDALSRFVIERSDRDNEREPLQGEIWLYALRNPEGMAIVADKLREQTDGLVPVIAAVMERIGTAPGINPDEMTTVALALFQGLVQRRRMDPRTVPDDLFARVLRRLFAPAPPEPAGATMPQQATGGTVEQPHRHDSRERPAPTERRREGKRGSADRKGAPEPG